MFMVENKLEFVLNSDSDSEITNINVNTCVNKVSYCSKCLRLLDNSNDIVRDYEGNLFCDSDCRADFWRENKKEMDSILENIR